MPTRIHAETAIAARDAGKIGLPVVAETNIQNRDDPASAHAAIAPVFQPADVRFCHLEGLHAPPSEDPQVPEFPHEALCRHSGPRMVEALTSLDMDAVGCASNVSCPCHAVMRSAAELSSAGLDFASIGENRAAAHDRPGTAILQTQTAHAPGRRAPEMPGAPPDIVTLVAPEVVRGLRQDVAGAKARADIVIVSCHWGASGSREHLSYQTVLGRPAIDAGADAVIGRHPHVLQRVEFH